MITSVPRLILCASMALSAAGVAVADDAPAIAYSIDVRLDPAARSLEGRERIAWRNTASHPASTIRFHVYFNAWDGAPVEVTRVAVHGAGAEGADRAGGVRFVPASDGAAPQDRTVIEVPLAAAVAPGEQVDIELAWRSRIPRASYGIGYVGDVFMLARWYPQLGVFGDDGWVCPPFRPPGGTFADFASYDVRIVVPRGWMVGATGAPAPAENRDGRETHRFTARGVHDFAWIAARSLDVSVRHLDDLNVDVELLLQPDHRMQADRYTAAARRVLTRLSEWFGPFPFPRVTIADPAWQSGGDTLAFPMFVTAAARWQSQATSMVPEGAIARGLAAQWWRAAVAPNEVDAAWLGEGITEFVAARVMPELFADRSRAPGSRFVTATLFGGLVSYPIRAVSQPFGVDSDPADEYRLLAKTASLAHPPTAYAPDVALTLARAKTAVGLETLEQYLGWPTLQRILIAYLERFRGGHPTPAQFFALANEVSGRDLSWFFDQVYKSADVFDYGIDRLAVEADRAATKSARYRSTIVVRRYGEGEFSGTGRPPVGAFESGDAVELAIAFSDGQSVIERWDGRSRWKAFTYEGAAAAVSAEVDPRGVIRLDTRRTNNSRTRDPRTAAAATKWSARWMVWLQDLLLVCAALV